MADTSQEAFGKWAIAPNRKRAESDAALLLDMLMRGFDRQEWSREYPGNAVAIIATTLQMEAEASRLATQEEDCRRIESLTEIKVHEIFHGLDGMDVDAQGFRKLTRAELSLLKAVARMLCAASPMREGMEKNG